MGLGMMRPGNMTGVLAVRIDRPGVKAGSVRFDVTNRSRAMPHEVLIVAVDDPWSAALRLLAGEGCG